MAFAICTSRFRLGTGCHAHRPAVVAELAYTREMMAGLLLRPPSAWRARRCWSAWGRLCWPSSSTATCPIAGSRWSRSTRRSNLSPASSLPKLPDDAQRLDVLIGCGADYMLSGGKHLRLHPGRWFDLGRRTGLLDNPCSSIRPAGHAWSDGLARRQPVWPRQDLPASVERLRQAFDQRVAVFPSCDSGNTIAFAPVAAAPVDVTLSMNANGPTLLKPRASTVSPDHRAPPVQLAYPLPDGRLTLDLSALILTVAEAYKEARLRPTTKDRRLARTINERVAPLQTQRNCSLKEAPCCQFRTLLLLRSRARRNPRPLPSMSTFRSRRRAQRDELLATLPKVFPPACDDYREHSAALDAGHWNTSANCRRLIEHLQRTHPCPAWSEFIDDGGRAFASPILATDFRFTADAFAPSPKRQRVTMFTAYSGHSRG